MVGRSHAGCGARLCAGAGARAGAPGVVIIDDTRFPRKGQHSVGMARQ
ncbi:hypothetical protein AB4Z48_29780 [Cupriavidus sp. 2TAF22]